MPVKNKESKLMKQPWTSPLHMDPDINSDGGIYGHMTLNVHYCLNTGSEPSYKAAQLTPHLP